MQTTQTGIHTMISKRQHADILADYDRLLALGKPEREAARVAVQNARRLGIQKADAEIAVLNYSRFSGSSIGNNQELL